MNTQVYAIPMTLYIEAYSPKMAAGAAELAAFSGSESLRMLESSEYGGDPVVHLRVAGKPVVHSEPITGEDYDKEPLKKAFGKTKAIKFMNNHMDKLYPY